MRKGIRMRRVAIILLCLLMIVVSGCKKKEVEVNVEPTITTNPTQSLPTKVPDSTMLTVTPLPTPVIVGKQNYTFQVQPITIPKVCRFRI